MENQTTELFDDVNAVIEELEVQFTDSKMLAGNTPMGPTWGCTYAATCNG